MTPLLLLDITEGLDPDGALCLGLTGELDLSSAPILRERLRDLSEAHRIIRLDLSRLEFMDSSGIQAILLAYRAAARDGWKLEIDPDVRPQVELIIEITGLRHRLWPPSGTPSERSRTAQPQSAYRTARPQSALRSSLI